MLRVCFLVLALPSSLFAEVDYVREIKPLLQTHCVKCHGGTTQKGGLRLDTAAAARVGGKHGNTLNPKAAEQSVLIQVLRGTHDEVAQMPYKRGPMDSVQVDLIERWIREGGKAPAAETPSDDRHWAYVAPQRPAGKNLSIDHFIAAGLKSQGLSFSAKAAPETLTRRLWLDLIGLPPLSPASMKPDLRAAVEAREIPALIEALLASEHYGERWGRWWLDQARYADSNGYSIDAPRSIWPYRDWVIQALNADMPFDQFSIEQLAGDLLPNATLAQQVATGFHRNTQINQEGGIDKEQFRIESVFDRVATTGTVWLGLTVGCAQCHDHKFDAISHREYYQFFAFLNNQDEPTLRVADAVENPAALKAEHAALLKQIDQHVSARQESLQAWQKGLREASKSLLPADARKILAKPASEISQADRRVLFKAMTGTADGVFNPLYDRHLELQAKISQGVTTLVMKELPKPRQTTLFIKGDFTRPAEVVQPGVLAVLPPLKSSSTPNRLDLARWLVARDNPLTARVIVNRVWQQYFGRGLVETENDFGTMGSLPTHPELLDWLALEFMDHGWSLKHLHRLIVSSRTYQQSSDTRPEGRRLDPDNRWWWRQNRLRLDAEIVRDVGLAASGLLVPTLGGPPVYPPIPEGVMGLGQVKRSWPLSRGEGRYRRGLYTFVFRATPPPGLSVFDAPDGFSTCTRRLRSNTPLQALTLLNDTAFVEFAQALAQIIQREGLEAGFRRCTSRSPRPDELSALAGLKPKEVARVLLNLDETITRE